MKKKVALFIALVFIVSLLVIPTTALAADSGRQSGSVWYPASGGWETTFSSSQEVVQGVLVPFVITDAWNANELRSFALRVLRERNADTTVQLTKSGYYSGTLHTDARDVAPGVYTQCLLVKVPGQFSNAVNVRGTVEVKSGVLPGTTVTAVTGVSLNRTSYTMNKGKKMQLKATVAPANATNPSVVWKSSNAKVATVDSSGKVTAKGNGSANISATTVDGGKIARCKVTVKTPAKSLKLNKTSATIKAGETVQLKVSAYTPASTYPKAITWKSSKGSVAKVDANGKVTGVAKGTAYIYAKAWNGAFAKCKVTVN